jgi:hypothetical protein
VAVDGLHVPADGLEAGDDVLALRLVGGGVEGDVVGVVDEDQVALANKLGALANSDLWNSIDSEGAVSKVFYGDVVNGDSTVSQAIESNKQILQDEIDTLKIQ